MPTSLNDIYLKFFTPGTDDVKKVLSGSTQSETEDEKSIIYLRAQEVFEHMWTNSWKTNTKAYKEALMYLVNCPMAQMVSANRLINAEGRFTVVDMGSASLGGGGGKLRQVETLSTPLDQPYLLEVSNDTALHGGETSERGYTSIFGPEASTRYMEVLP